MVHQTFQHVKIIVNFYIKLILIRESNFFLYFEFFTYDDFSVYLINLFIHNLNVAFVLLSIWIFEIFLENQLSNSVFFASYSEQCLVFVISCSYFLVGSRNIVQKNHWTESILNNELCNCLIRILLAFDLWVKLRKWYSFIISEINKLPDIMKFAFKLFLNDRLRHRSNKVEWFSADRALILGDSPLGYAFIAKVMLQTWIDLCLLTYALLLKADSAKKGVAVKFFFLIFYLLLKYLIFIY